jgi:cytosine/adenosine deaminase-related metal-dependent hydrolase
LAVHAVHASPADLAVLRARGSTVVTCPRSNRHVGAGDPPVSAFFASGVRVAVGTDSLSSVGDLNLFAEIGCLRELAPGVAPSRLLAAATLGGAAALGLDGDWGSIQPDKRAALIGVAVPPGLTDVEQYLVSGITPTQVRWIENGVPC